MAGKRYRVISITRAEQNTTALLQPVQPVDDLGNGPFGMFSLSDADLIRGLSPGDEVQVSVTKV